MNLSSIHTASTGIIVACETQPVGPKDSPEDIARRSHGVVAGGAVTLSLGVMANFQAGCEGVHAPVFRLAKRDLANSPTRRKAYPSNANEPVDAGCFVIAYYATEHPRPDSTRQLVDTNRRGAS